jgi:hypothetical protein
LQAVALNHFLLMAVVAAEGQVVVAVLVVVVAVNCRQGKLGRYQLQAQEMMRI